MARILAIDYGAKRTGIAVTDPGQIIATALTTLESPKLLDFLKEYLAAEMVEEIIIGMPINSDGGDTHATPLVRGIVRKIRKAFPGISLKEVDERMTSVMARNAMLEMGMKKKDRRVKGNVDQIAAAIMLQEYLSGRGTDFLTA
jgi:putative Holliday junction resolvase